jgi:hypothetical protein
MDGVAVGSAMDGAAVGAAMDCAAVGAAMDGAAVGAAVDGVVEDTAVEGVVVVGVELGTGKRGKNLFSMLFTVMISQKAQSAVADI